MNDPNIAGLAVDTAAAERRGRDAPELATAVGLDLSLELRIPDELVVWVGATGP